MRPLRLLPLVLLGLAIVGGIVLEQIVGVDRHGATVASVDIDSKEVGTRLRTTVVVPPGRPPGKRPLLVFLHGRSGNSQSELDDAFFSALASLGDRAPLVAFPNGGNHSYWHDRGEGAWGSYVVREVIPTVVDRFGADRRRVAIGGISMGGFGAYDIARLNPGRFCAVGGHSPALWRSGGETAPGAFDNAEDFERHDVIAAAQADPSAFAGRGTRLWLDAGRDDPFQPGDQAFREALGSRLEAQLSRPGGHDDDYWNAHWPAYARFYARALADC